MEAHELAEKFEWKDVKENQTDITGYELANEIMLNADSLVASTIGSKVGYFDGEQVIIPIPDNTILPLMVKCMDDSYTDDSRQAIMSLIRSLFRGLIQNFIPKLNNNINSEIIPLTDRNKYIYKISDLGLYDNVDCSVVGAEPDKDYCKLQVEIILDREKRDDVANIKDRIEVICSDLVQEAKRIKELPDEEREKFIK